MADYDSVQKALAGGADPAMLCTTCPWDRTCLTPPAMTRAEIDAQIKKGAAQDEAAAKRSFTGEPHMPVGTLMSALIYAGKDTSAGCCPVFALRLRSSGGREIADGLKERMQQWDDQR